MNSKGSKWLIELYEIKKNDISMSSKGLAKLINSLWN
jgi:hypothetical protein